MKKFIWMATVICVIAVSGLSVLFNYQMQFIIEAITLQNKTQFVQVSVLLIGTVLLLLVFEYGRQVLNAKYLTQIGAYIHQTTLLRYFSDNQKTDNRSASERVSSLNNDIEMVKNLHYDTVISLIQGVVSFLFAFSALLSLDLITALGIIVSLTFPIFLPFLFKGTLVANQERIVTTKAQYNTKATDFLGNLIAIRNSRFHTQITEDTLSTYENMNSAVYYQERTKALLNVLTGLAFYSTTIIILVIGGLQVLAGHLTVGGLVATYAIAQELTLPATLISDALADIQSVQTIRQQLLLPFFVDKRQTLKILLNIKLNHVSYQQDDKVLLKPVTAELIHGNHYLIKGPSGVGKSTLLGILTGNLGDFLGNLTFNDFDASQFSYQSLQNQIGYISQGSKLFHDSILNNVTNFSVKNVNVDQLMSLIKTFQLSDRFPTIESLQEVYNEDTSLSSGQIQRLLLIRTLLENKSWLIIDEGLSALDSALYDQIEGFLLSQNKVSLIHVSHRPSKHLEDYEQIIIT